MKREQIDKGRIGRREFLTAAGAAGVGTLLGVWSERAEAQGDVSRAAPGRRRSANTWASPSARNTPRSNSTSI
jgi:hypothetical protein